MEKRIFLIRKCNVAESVHLNLNEPFIAKRILQAYRCKSVLIAKSINPNDISFFIGVLCEDQEKQVNFKGIEKLFREFKTIQFRKGFAPICCYFVRGGEFFLFGNFSREEIFQIAENSRQHRKLLSSIPKKESRSYNNGRGTKKGVFKKERTLFSISRGDLFLVKRFCLGGLGLCTGYFLFHFLLNINKSVAFFLIIFFQFLEKRIFDTELLESAKPLENDAWSTPEPRPTPTPVYVTVGLFVCFTIVILIYQNR